MQQNLNVMEENRCQNRIKRPKKHRKWSYSSIVYFKKIFCNAVLLLWNRWVGAGKQTLKGDRLTKNVTSFKRERKEKLRSIFYFLMKLDPNYIRGFHSKRQFYIWISPLKKIVLISVDDFCKLLLFWFWRKIYLNLCFDEFSYLLQWNNYNLRC